MKTTKKTLRELSTIVSKCCKEILLNTVKLDNPKKKKLTDLEKKKKKQGYELLSNEEKILFNNDRKKKIAENRIKRDEINEINDAIISATCLKYNINESHIRTIIREEEEYENC